jgi:hypothetical protein
LLLAAALLLAQSAEALTPAQKRVVNQGPLSNITAFRSYVRSQQPTMFLDPDYVGSDRENLATYSADTSNADWTKTGATVSTVTITASAGASAHTAAQLKTGVTPLGTNYRVSFKAKAGTFSVLCSYEADGSLFNGVTVNLATGAIAQTANLVSSSISTADSNGYYSVEYVYTVEGASSNTRITVGIPSNTSQTTCNSWSAAGTETILVKELQLQRASQNAVYTETTATPIYGPSPGITSVNVVSSINSLYGSTAAFTQSTDANKPILSKPDRVENLLLQSEDFTGSNWNIYRATRTANTTANPVNGATTADTITEDSTAANSHVLEVATANIVSGVAYRFSLYVKQGSGSRNIDMVLSSGFPGSSNAYFNPTTGALVSAGAGLTSTQSEDMGNGWWRFTTTATATSSVTTTPIYIYMASGTTTSYNGDGTSSLILFGAQLQRSSMQPTYVATTTAPVYGSLTGRRMLTFDGSTKALSSTTTTGNIFTASAKEYFQVLSLNTSATDQTVLRPVSGYFSIQTSGTDILFKNYDGTSDSAGAAWTANAPFVAYGRHDAGTLYSQVNRGAAGTGASGNTTDTSTALFYGSGNATGSSSVNGQLGPIITFNRVLPQPVRDTIRAGLQKFWRVN